MILRCLHALNLVLMLLMTVLGFMAGFSGGGTNPAFQRYGSLLMMFSIPIAVASVIVAEVLWQLDVGLLALAVNLVPLVVWGTWIGLLQAKTGFFR